MSDRETLSPREQTGARLPSDPAYWSALRGQVMDQVRSAQAPVGSSWHVPIAPWLAAAALAAVVLGWSLVPARRGESVAQTNVIARDLLPDDPLAAPLVTGSAPALSAMIGAPTRDGP